MKLNKRSYWMRLAEAPLRAQQVKKQMVEQVKASSNSFQGASVIHMRLWSDPFCS